MTTGTGTERHTAWDRIADTSSFIFAPRASPGSPLRLQMHRETARIHHTRDGQRVRDWRYPSFARSAAYALRRVGTHTQQLSALWREDRFAAVLS
jgi:hypothetical protein